VDTDVAIIGAGAAGGILALELARRGMGVVVLEAGPRWDLARRGESVRRFLRREDPWPASLPGLDRYTVGGPVPYQLAGRRARGIGGSTLAWEGYALRMHPDDFRMRSLYGIAEDWPLAYSDLEAYYGAAEAALGVAGAADDPWTSPRSTPFPLAAFAFSYSDGVFARAGQSLGISLQHLPQARNSIAYGGRSQCRACGTCQACPTGAKASVDLTHVPRAEATGRVRVLTETAALRLEVDASGEVGSIVYAARDKVEQRLTARVYVLAGGAVENARLLLLSASREFPSGVANRSGLVGKFFMSHPSIDVVGRARENVYPYRIGFSTAMSRRFAVERARATRGAFLLEFLNSAGPTPERIALASGLWGDALRRRVREEFGHWLGIRVYAEQLPAAVNAVSLNPRVTDYFGSAAPHIHYSVGQYERRALDEAKDICRRTLSAAGVTDIQVSGMSFAGHQMGTHRMGTDPARSVVDANLRAHDVPNLYLVGAGSFVTAGASPPTLTIAALAVRASEHIAGRLRPSASAVDQRA
jgi:choline dehydrogenase-like flavoprotein